VGWWDRAAILALGGAGCALSYDALQQMAVAIHVRPQLSYLFPLVIDGFIAYGIRALLVMSTAPLRARLYTWTLFATATTASIWANALHAVRLNQQARAGGLRLGDHVVAVLSTIAPLALAGAVHLYILITRHHTAPDDQSTHGAADRPTTPITVPASPEGTIRTERLPHRHPRTDHGPGLGLRTEREPQHGPDQPSGTPQHEPAAQQVPGPAQQTQHRYGDHGPADHRGGNRHRPQDREPSLPEAAPAERGHTAGPPADHGTPAGSEHRAQEHNTHTPTGPRPATEPTAPAAPGPTAQQRAFTGRPADPEPPVDARDTPSASRPSRPVPAGPAAAGAADQDTRAAGRPIHEPGGGSADRERTATADRHRPGSTGPNIPEHADRFSDAADHSSTPDRAAGGPPDRPEHTAQDRRAFGDRGPQPRSGPRPFAQHRERGTRTGDLEQLLQIARQAALAEGRMTRRALRPYLNQAGVPISNERFTELQQRLYADPALAHLPRPRRRT
jgi:hypothetical protein